MLVLVTEQVGGPGQLALEPQVAKPAGEGQRLSPSQHQCQFVPHCGFCSEAVSPVCKVEFRPQTGCSGSIKLLPPASFLGEQACFSASSHGQWPMLAVPSCPQISPRVRPVPIPAQCVTLSVVLSPGQPLPLPFSPPERCQCPPGLRGLQHTAQILRSAPLPAEPHPHGRGAGGSGAHRVVSVASVLL